MFSTEQGVEITLFEKKNFLKKQIGPLVKLTYHTRKLNLYSQFVDIYKRYQFDWYDWINIWIDFEKSTQMSCF